MLYYLTRPLARIALKVFFRKIHLANVEGVPANKPLILAANHPAAFMEPCLLAVLLPQALFFLVKGDLFDHPLNRTLLESWHMWPIYSRDDGFEKLKQNKITMDRCYQAFAQNKTILIMAEGHTLHEKRLRPIQKGPARLAFGAIKENKELDLQIIPVAVNYTYADQFRGEVMFDFGAPIAVKDYLELYENEPGKAIREVTRLITCSLKKKVIHIDKKEDEQLVEWLLVMRRNDIPDPVLPVLIQNDQLLKKEKALVDAINAMPASQKFLLRKELSAYFDQLNQWGIDDVGLTQPGYYNPSYTLTLIIGFVPFMLGYILNYLPARVAKYIADTVAKRREFYSSVLVSTGLGLFVLYYLMWIILALIINDFSFWWFVLLIPIWGYFALLFRELYQKWNNGRLVNQLSAGQLEAIRAKRAQFDFLG